MHMGLNIKRQKIPFYTLHSPLTNQKVGRIFISLQTWLLFGASLIYKHSQFSSKQFTPCTSRRGRIGSIFCQFQIKFIFHANIAAVIVLNLFPINWVEWVSFSLDNIKTTKSLMIDSWRCSFLCNGVNLSFFTNSINLIIF